MGRKHKFVNKTHYPDWAIERLTRSIYDDVLAFFATEEGQREYALWEEEQARIKASSCPSKSKRSAAFGASNASCEQEQAEYEAWEREQEELKKKRAAATKVVAAHSFIWFFWADRYGGMSAHKGQNKQIIRTLFQFGKSGSDYICLVHRKGLEPPTLGTGIRCSIH